MSDYDPPLPTWNDWRAASDARVPGLPPRELEYNAWNDGGAGGQQGVPFRIPFCAIIDDVETEMIGTFYVTNPEEVE